MHPCIQCGGCFNIGEDDEGTVSPKWKGAHPDSVQKLFAKVSGAINKILENMKVRIPGKPAQSDARLFQGKRGSWVVHFLLRRVAVMGIGKLSF
ncbi:hypothetical protein SLEP1_g45345 [Rubroshorea leprosula]|uniref:Uncharacterized protein n=1 Tax=Rubroshorea leprosula TaxID=152421 RepID=A0AAV5LJI2_9ROSI|nr:hypothetical protein SLEP1_g45345 [Rubroshorea leprosula]